MALLEVVDISVAFGGLLALDNAALDVDPGHVTGLIGPNGAGKTTLFNVITGLQTPTSGEVRLDGQDLSRVKRHRRARLGVARTFQRLEAFGSLTARENVLVALEMRKRWATDAYDTNTVADELLADVGISPVADQRVESLPTGTARLVELARALATGPRVLLLDEPSSGLTETETETLGELLLSLAAGGLAILLVEHDMSFVMGTCAQIHVLDFGRMVAKGNPAEVQSDVIVQRAYLGTHSGSGT